MVEAFQTRQASQVPDVIAPDGSEVRILCSVSRGGMALFTLPEGTIARAVTHRSVEEVWYIAAGSGRMWRRLNDREQIVALVPGVSVSLPVGTHFQFRNDGKEPLIAVGTTMPPWPGAQEAVFVAGAWAPTA